MPGKKNFQTLLKKYLTWAVAIGLITGLLEGILLVSLHQSELLTWRLQNRAIWYETLWIAPLVDLVLFTLAGGIFALVGWFLPRLPIRKIAWFTFILLAVFDWLFIILFGKISLVAIVLLAAGISFQIFISISKREVAISSQLQKALPRLAGLTILFLVAVQGGGWVNEKIKTANLPDDAIGTQSPNVLVIVVDTLRADHLSSYGYERDTSPFMDGLAAEGVRFENAISPSSWTQPSHASMLTGRYTYEHQAETAPLDETYPTIGEVMQENGYRTGAFSANTLFFTRRQGHGRGFIHFEDNYQSISDAFFNSSLYGFIFDFYGLRKALKYEGVPTRVHASEINEAVLNWMDKDGEKPFFVFMNYFDVHDPYTPPEPYRSKYASVPNPGGLINGFMERYSPSLTPEQIQTEIDAYDGSIAYVDDQIKSLFNELDARGLLDNTVIIITSDHGELLGEHGLLQHSTSLYLDEIHVPLIVWGPKQDVPTGKVVDTPVSLTSLPSTILSLIDSNNDPFPGPSLTILMSEEEVPANWPDPIAELAHLVGAPEINPSTHGAMKSVVGTEYQYIVHEKFGEELYNWRTDPQEINNLIENASSKSTVDIFRRYLLDLLGELFGTQ
ncbi:MAG: sulfatase [Anaerolineales bacterium]|nr:sulfatase [Anaerolineales bacterium]